MHYFISLVFFLILFDDLKIMVTSVTAFAVRISGIFCSADEISIDISYYYLRWFRGNA